MSVNVGDVVYRFEDVRYASLLDEYENQIGRGRVVVEERKYEVSRTTDKGFWIAQFGITFRFVRADARKKFAHESRDDALKSFIARKTRQISILSHQLEDAKLAKYKAESMHECKQGL